MPVSVELVCDNCGHHRKGTFVVAENDPASTRFEYARASARADGWQCDSDGDLCAPCATARAAESAQLGTKQPRQENIS